MLCMFHRCRFLSAVGHPKVANTALLALHTRYTFSETGNRHQRNPTATRRFNRSCRFGRVTRLLTVAAFLPGLGRASLELFQELTQDGSGANFIKCMF